MRTSLGRLTVVPEPTGPGSHAHARGAAEPRFSRSLEGGASAGFEPPRNDRIWAQRHRPDYAKRGKREKRRQGDVTFFASPALEGWKSPKPFEPSQLSETETSMTLRASHPRGELPRSSLLRADLDRQLGPAMTATSVQHLPSALGLHAGPESMLVDPLAIAGTICRLHLITTGFRSVICSMQSSER